MPELASPHVLMGNILLREGKRATARQEYEAYLRLEPNGPMAAGAHQMIEKIGRPYIRSNRHTFPTADECPRTTSNL